ncbi:AAA family ATPase [Aliarcobacter cryaerophilus]|uniref:DnaB-like helicase N-terminal domain-containing protein n=1 Tax=Aliarcobacter cryaerophilus TaxID=28198 RepID=UPI003DA41AED
MNHTINYSNDCLLAIEKTVLSAMIFNNDYDIIEDSLKIIVSNDFMYEQNSIIYDTIIKLYKSDEIIDEHTVYMANPSKINQEYYTSVITTTPISSIIEYLKHIKKDSIQRQIKICSSKILANDLSHITKLQDLREQLEKLDDVKNLKNIDEKFEKMISSFDLDLNKIKDEKIEYLYDNFIIKNDITMIVSRPGIGKSLITFSLCNMLLRDGKIKRVFYLDGDNSRTTIKSRNIEPIKEKYQNQLNYFIELKDSNFSTIINQLKNKNLSDMLIVLDSIKHFIIGDRNIHKDVTDLMKILKELRNNKATVIFLHHQNKLNKDFNSAFAGSSAFMEDISLAYELKRNDDKQTYIFNPLKDRNNISSRIAFQYNNDNTLTKVDYHYAIETNEDIEIREVIISFIAKHKDKPIYSEIVKYLEKSGYNKDKVNIIMQNGKNVYWKVTKLPQYNKTIYTLIDREDNQDKSIKGEI